MSDFIHLHIHSEYSLLDGACRIKRLVARVKELGQTAAAVTDHGNMYGAVEFYSEAKAQGIKPIIGCEIYVAPRSRFDTVHGVDNKPFHLVLLCRDNTGYQNLIKLASLGYTEGFYGKPRVDIELLRKYSGGLIALSACLAGEIPRLLLNGEYETAKKTALLYRDIFGPDSFYLEIQNHGIEEQLRILPLIFKLSNETKIPLAASNDAHYPEKEDAKIQKVLIAIQTNSTVNDPNSGMFPTDEFYIKSSEEMSALFANAPEAVSNTLKIAAQCNVEIEFGKLKLPRFFSGKENAPDYLREICFKGARGRYGESLNSDITARIDYELDIINKMGFSDYFLIVWDFVSFAKKKGIPVGPGRGSGAGSIVAYCTGITGIDPVKYNLLFERFLNPERVSMPDFDIDFCYERRQEAIDYVIAKYGADRVAQIVTFGTMAARAAVRDVGRVLRLSYSLIDRAAKLIPHDPGMTLDKAVSHVPVLKELYYSDKSVRELIDIAKKIEGMPRHTSTHAAGVVISDAPVSDYVPLAKNDQTVITQYPMNILESLGMLKMDFLGLRTLTVIDGCAKAAGIDIEKIPLDDKETFDMISAGNTSGVFQFESAGMRQVLSSLKPEAFEDLIAVLALYRPGPMDSIPKYIERRHNREKINYKHPMLSDILNVTYGCIVYQEQVMEICRVMAGYSYGGADIVRRAMSKKKTSVMNEERAVFVRGAINNGVSESAANDIFDEISGFASYAFNKSHAAAYALLSYRTAFLKRRYYKEFMSELMTSVLYHTNKLIGYISECEKKDIKIMRPDINESMAGFTASGDGIRFGLLAVKNLGYNTIEAIVTERENNGKFKSLSDFCSRMTSRDINKKAAESLIMCGALDGFGISRKGMTDNYDELFKNLSSFNRADDGQISFFGSDASFGDVSDKSIDAPEYPFSELLEKEKEVAGMYISGHPLQQFDVYASALNIRNISEITDEETVLRDGDGVSVLGVMQGLKNYTTKSNERMAFIRIEDITGEIEGIVFSSLYNKNSALLKKGEIFAIDGKITYKDDSPKIIAEKISPADRLINNCRSMDIIIKCVSSDLRVIEEIIKICRGHAGERKLFLYFSDLKKKAVSKSITGVNISKELLKALISAVGDGNLKLTG